MKALLYAALLLSLPAYAEVSIQGSPDETRAFLSKSETLVTLKGKASTTVEASEIKVAVRVTSEGTTQTAALTTHEEQKRTLLSQLQSGDIQRGNITVPKFATLTPKYSASGDRATGYLATSTLTVSLTEQAQFLNLLASPERGRFAEIGEITYDHAQLANLRKQILANACKQAMSRKEVYEQSLGVTLRPVSITETAAPDQIRSYDPSRFGQITIQAEVAVNFEIKPGTPPAPTTAPAPAAAPTPQ